MEINDFYKNLGKNIKKLREAKRLTQEILAEKSGISQDYLGKIEVNINRPGLKTIYKIATALDLDPAELLNFNN